MLIVRLATGVMTAVVRFFLTVAVALITLTRADVSPLPAWIERYFLLDTGSKSFQAAVKAYHHFNNPIFRVACWILAEDPKRRRQAVLEFENGVATVGQLCGRIRWYSGSESEDDDEGDTSKSKKEAVSTKDTRVTVRTRRRSGLGVLRWRLAIMLHRFPQLRYYRAHYLARKDAKKPNYWKQQLSRDDPSMNLVPTPRYASESVASFKVTAERIAAELTNR